MKICIACSAGGHLTEMMLLSKVYSVYDHFFLTTKRQDTIDLSKEERVIFITDPGRNPFLLLKNIIESFRVIRKERPDIIMSTGAGIALAPCYIAKFLFREKTKVIWIDGIAAVYKKSLSGRLAYPMADLFLVQWKGMCKKYGKNTKYWGAVI